MTREEILSHVDHTLLKPEATWPQIQTLCDEAIANHTASVCINTCYVKQAVEYMAGRIPVCCVVGFPLGAMDTASKCFEAKTAVENGAEEVDMVMNLTALKSQEFSYIKEELTAVREAIPTAILKVIIEAPHLTEAEIRQAVELCIEARADYAKTSTGWYPEYPSTVEQVRIMSREAAGRIQIKAAGGIRSLETIQEMQKAGCSRFGMGMRSVQNLIKSIYK
mgnify:CR=1 FL=1